MTDKRLRQCWNYGKIANKEIADQATYWVSFRQSNDWYKLADWSKINIDPAHERKIAEMKVKRSYVLDARMPFDEKRRSARDMARDVIGSNMILSLVVTEKFPKDLYHEVSDLMLNHPDQTIRIQASQYFSTELNTVMIYLPLLHLMLIQKGKDNFYEQVRQLSSGR